MEKILAFLRAKGFKKQRWDKCPQGFKEKNYQCFAHEDLNIYCEVYLSDPIPYGWIVGNGIKGSGYLSGKFFSTLAEIKATLSIKQ